MKGSGKQVLLGVIRRLSKVYMRTSEELEAATDQIRAALLIHGSSSSDYHGYANTLNWASSPDSGDTRTQGLVVGGQKLPVSELLESIFECPGLQDYILSRYSGMSEKEFEAGLWSLWTMISALQMNAEDLDIEVDEDLLNLNEWINYMSEKHRLFNAGKY